MTGPPKGVFLEDVQKPEQASEAAKTRKTRQQSRPKGMPKKLLLFDFDIISFQNIASATIHTLVMVLSRKQQFSHTHLHLWIRKKRAAILQVNLQHVLRELHRLGGNVFNPCDGSTHSNS